MTIDEFVQAQRFLPIVFSAGANPVPLGLMGLNEGINTFTDDEGKLRGPTYVPAYVRRYPFMLAKLRPDSERSEEHTSELQSLMRISYAVFCLKKKKNQQNI